MASRRLAPESFDAIMQVKAKRYRLDQSDPINEALHQLRAHSRPVLRTPYGGEEEGLQEDRSYAQSTWRKDSRADYAAPSHRSSSRDLEEDDYYEESVSRLPPRARGYHQPSVAERDYTPSSSSSGVRDYGHLSLRDYGHTAPRSLHSSSLSADEFVSAGRPGYEAEYPLAPKREFSPALHLGRGKRGPVPLAGVLNTEDLAGPVKKWSLPGSAEDPRRLLSTQPLPLSLPILGDQKRFWVPKGTEDKGLPPSDPASVFSAFGTEIIKWAGFHKAKKDSECRELFEALFTVETETCAKTLAAFKCPLKYEHQQFCLYSLKNIQHVALRKPQVDNTFLNFLMHHKVMETKQAFFEVIGPFDRVLMKLQYYLLKSATPLLMACNGYEVNLKAGNLGTPAQVSAAFETTAGLCRKALVLLGQTFALASSERQEKILEALGIQQAAPSPTMFPNLDTSALFGREYIEHLQSWLDKSGYQMKLKEAAAVAAATSPPAQSPPPETKPKIKAPQRADRKVAATIEKLVSDVVSGVLTDQESSERRSDPEYWFLQEKDSLEYKYYQLKLAEAERQRAEEEKAPEQLAPEVVRALLYRKKIVSLKKKLFRGKKPGILQRAARAKRGRRANVSTQTLLSAGTALKQLLLGQNSQGPVPDLGDLFSDGAASELLDSSPSLESQFPDVDPKTMVTAQKLAEFVADVGPEIEQFSIDNSAGNPDLWFLLDRESSAFRFYRLKVRELCPTIDFKEGPEEPPLQSPGGSPLEEPPANETEEGGKEAEGGAEGPAEGPAGSDTAEAPPEAASPAPAQATPFLRRKRVSSKSLKVGLIPAPKRVCLIDEPQVHDPVQIAYDRPRGYPSYKKNKQKDLEFKHKRLNQKNIGFQMLQKMGWKEGLGLGTHGEGIKEPVRVGSTSAGEGLGVTGEKKEDTFASFRHRMTQMYYMKRGNK